MASYFAQSFFLENHVVSLSDSDIHSNRVLILDRLISGKVLQGVGVAAQENFLTRIIALVSQSNILGRSDVSTIEELLDKVETGVLLLSHSMCYLEKTTLQKHMSQISNLMMSIASPSQSFFVTLEKRTDVQGQVAQISLRCLNTLVSLYESIAKFSDLRREFHSEFLPKLVPLISFFLQETVVQVNTLHFKESSQSDKVKFNVGLAASKNGNVAQLLKLLLTVFQTSAKTSVPRLKQVSGGLRSFVLSGLSSLDEETRQHSAHLIWHCVSAEGAEAQQMFIMQVFSAYYAMISGLLPKQLLAPKEQGSGDPLFPNMEDSLTAIIVSHLSEQNEVSQNVANLLSFIGVSECVSIIMKSDINIVQRPSIPWGKFNSLISSALAISQKSLKDLVADSHPSNMSYQMIGMMRAVEFLSFNIQRIQKCILDNVECIFSNRYYGQEFEKFSSPIYFAVIQRLSADADLDVQQVFFGSESESSSSMRNLSQRIDFFRFASSLLPWPYGYSHVRSEFTTSFLPQMIRQSLKDIEISIALRFKAQEIISMVYDGNLKLIAQDSGKKRKGDQNRKNNTSSIGEINFLHTDLRILEDVDSIVCSSIEFLIFAIKASASSALDSGELKSQIIKTICSSLMDICTQFGSIKLHVSGSLRALLFEALSACCQTFLQIFPHPSLLGLVSKLFQIGLLGASPTDWKVRTVCADGLRQCELLVHPRLRPKLTSGEHFMNAFAFSPKPEFVDNFDTERDSEKSEFRQVSENLSHYSQEKLDTLNMQEVLADKSETSMMIEETKQSPPQSKLHDSPVKKRQFKDISQEMEVSENSDNVQQEPALNQCDDVEALSDSMDSGVSISAILGVRPTTIENMSSEMSEAMEFVDEAPDSDDDNGPLWVL